MEEGIGKINSDEKLYFKKNDFLMNNLICMLQIFSTNMFTLLNNISGWRT